jgi:hypothetical protein
MADQTDVENAIAGLIAGYVYPQGISLPPAQGVAAAIFPGWPVPAQLDADLASGKAQISVVSTPSVRETTRFPYAWKTVSITAPTITATVQNRTITLGGSMPSPFSPTNIVIVTSANAFAYAVQPADTLSSIAAALATLINAVLPGATSSGPVISMAPSGPLPQARVGGVGTSVLEVGRYEQLFKVMLFAPSPVARAALMNGILPYLGDTPFLSMPDGTAARMRVVKSADYDTGQKAQSYRREIDLLCEFGVTQTQQTAVVTDLQVSNLNSTTLAVQSVSNQ